MKNTLYWHGDSVSPDVPGETFRWRYHDVENAEAVAQEVWFSKLQDHSPLLEGPMSKAVRAFVGEPIAWLGDVAALPGYVIVVGWPCPEPWQDEFDRWYLEEHAPVLLEEESWLACRWYRVIESRGEPYTRLIVHHLADLAAIDSPARNRSRSTEWRKLFASTDWFEASGRWVQTVDEALSVA